MKANEKNRSIRVYHKDGRVAGIISLSGDAITLAYDGKSYSFSYHSYLGPCFVNKDGSESKRYPGQKNSWWDGFTLWQKQGMKTKNGHAVFTKKGKK
jgi:hypothetical protein